MSFAADAARALEKGRSGVVSSALARVWSSFAEPVRPLHFPEWARVVGVGGAVLGGSGKTPLAIAIAAALAERSTNVAFVGHAYAAKPGRPRVVRPDDPLEEVGDEALVAARALEERDVPVVVGPSRQSAVDLALSLAPVLVVDGMLQSKPLRCALSLLAVDLERPWGSGACPPAGDLRAPVPLLLEACDEVVPVVSSLATRGAWVGSRLISWNELRGLRVGLWTFVARPDRIVASLARQGIFPIQLKHEPDHGRRSTIPLRPAIERGRDPAKHELDLWLASPKCAIHLPKIIGDAPVATLEHDVLLSRELMRTVQGAVIDGCAGSP